MGITECGGLLIWRGFGTLTGNNVPFRVVGFLLRRPFGAGRNHFADAGNSFTQGAAMQ